MISGPTCRGQDHHVRANFFSYPEASPHHRHCHAALATAVWNQCGIWKVVNVELYTRLIWGLSYSLCYQYACKSKVGFYLMTPRLLISNVTVMQLLQQLFRINVTFSMPLIWQTFSYFNRCQYGVTKILF